MPQDRRTSWREPCRPRYSSPHAVEVPLIREQKVRIVILSDAKDLFFAGETELIYAV